MRVHFQLFALLLFLGGSAFAGDWITEPSTYTHDPETGRRTSQYHRERPAYFQPRRVVVSSGFRHTRGSIQVGGVSDNFHTVERWGEPVRPYGEWRFPYRPYSVPYPAWGPPVVAPFFGPFAGRFGGGHRGGPGYGGPGYGGGHPGMPDETMPDSGNVDLRRHPYPATPGRWRPWHDGSYPTPPRDFYQWADPPYPQSTVPRRRPPQGGP